MFMKVALIADPITQAGGAEKLLWSLADKFPNAPLFTAVANPSVVPKRFSQRIKVSWVQKLPASFSNPKPYLPLLPLAYESFDLNDFDRVISITTLFAKAVITKPETLHLGYINSPPRFLYSQSNLKRYINNDLIKGLSTPILNWLKSYDQIATRRPDILIANSKNIQKKIADIYKLDSKVVYPFAQNSYFDKNLSKKIPNQFVIVSRLEKWKQLDYAIEAFNARKDLRLIIVGVGQDFRRLKKLAKSNTSFSGWLPNSSVAELISSSCALIMPQNEDFGITSVEAQALGTPVISPMLGGALETVINNQTGLFFAEQNSHSLLHALEVFNTLSFQTDKLKQNALKYRQERFIQQITSYL